MPIAILVINRYQISFSDEHTNEKLNEYRVSPDRIQVKASEIKVHRVNSFAVDISNI